MSGVVGPPGPSGASASGTDLVGHQTIAYNVTHFSVGGESAAPQFFARSHSDSATNTGFGTKAFVMPRDGVLTSLDATVVGLTLAAGPPDAILTVGVWLADATASPVAAAGATVQFAASEGTAPLYRATTSGAIAIPLPAGTRVSLAISTSEPSVGLSVDSISASIRV